MRPPSADPAPFAFTVDVESDWGTATTRGLREALPRLLALLERRRARATFFVVGELAAEFRAHLPPAGPHEVGSHGHTHRVLTGLDDAEVRAEVETSRRRLQAEGYRVDGFRAPFLRAPRRLPKLLGAAGYTYDASGGSVLPSLRNLRRGPVAAAGAAHGVRRLPPSALRDRVTPFSLTWLRLYHPLGLRLVPRGPAVFYCHLHELIAGGGWPTLAAPLRRLHARRTGAPAWDLLESLLAGRPAVTCRELLAGAAAAAPAQLSARRSSP